MSAMKARQADEELLTAIKIALEASESINPKSSNKTGKGESEAERAGGLLK